VDEVSPFLLTKLSFLNLRFKRTLKKSYNARNEKHITCCKNKLDNTNIASKEKQISSSAKNPKSRQNFKIP
jgi:hypothetical protein